MTHEQAAKAKNITLIGNDWAGYRGKDGEAHAEAAYDCCRGTYQVNLACGCEAVSGSTLKGTARRFKGKYMESQAALFERWEAAGVVFTILRLGQRNVLVFGNA